MVTETKAEKLAGEKLLFMTHRKFNWYIDQAQQAGRRQGLRETVAQPASEDCQAMAAIRRHRLQISYELCYCPSCLGEDGIFYVHTTDGRKTNGCQDLAGMILLVAKELDRSDKTKGGEQ